MSTKNSGNHSFDQGSQYFSVKSNAFADFLKPFKDNDTVEEWHPNIVEIGADGQTTPITWNQPRYVGSPGMRGLCEALADELKIELGKKITRVENRKDGNWLILGDGQSLGPYEWVVTTTPSHQAAVLLPIECSIQTALSAVHMKGCYALMLGFGHQLDMVITPFMELLKLELGSQFILVKFHSGCGAYPISCVRGYHLTS